jgi:hypothetical protein
MTLPAELRQEADRTIQVSHDGGGMYVYRYYHDEATRALLHRAADALEWRDIASAPMDGTHVLGANIYRGEYNSIGEYWMPPARKEFWTDGEWRVYPTHWLPLPATPEGDHG